MARGHQHWWSEPPWWAWALIVAGLVFLIVGTPIALQRANVDASATAPAPAVETTPAAPEPEPPLPVTRPTDGPLRVLFTGDSLTGGYYATTEDRSFRSRMISVLGEVEQTSASRAGETLTTVSVITDVPPNLDLAVVELGTNDVGEKTPIDEFRASYTALLDRIRASSPDAVILCAGTWVDEPGGYDPAIKQACDAAGGRFVPLAGLFDQSALHGPPGVDVYKGVSDEFHPNDAGHQAIADALLAAVTVQ